MEQPYRCDTGRRQRKRRRKREVAASYYDASLET